MHIRFLIAIATICLTQFTLTTFARAAEQGPPLTCPPEIASLKTSHLSHGTLCEIYARYHRAVARLESEGVAPAQRISNFMAPRLINEDKWFAQAAAYKYDPTTFYKPAPITWVAWERGLDIIDDMVRRNQFTQTITPINTEILQFIQSHTMSGDGLMKPGFTPGSFTHDQMVGVMLIHEQAVTETQQRMMAAGANYKNLEGQPLLKWTPLKCFEDLDMSMKIQQKEHRSYQQWTRVPVNEFYTDSAGARRQCGIVTYAPIQEVPSLLNQWINSLNTGLLQYHQGVMTGDPLEFMAHVQRFFITIHPFQDGNGRTSRFMLEYITKNMMLPPPILKHLDDDIYDSEDQWASEIGEGLWHAVEVLETCAANRNAPGCNLVPKAH